MPESKYRCAVCRRMIRPGAEIARRVDGVAHKGCDRRYPYRTSGNASE